MSSRARRRSSRSTLIRACNGPARWKASARRRPSSFSLLPAENTSGNWVKVVQRIPMRVRLDSAPDKPQLRMGMSVELSVATGHPRGVPSVIKHLFGFGEA